MLNLIPPEGHAMLKKEYVLRVGATLAFLFGCVFILLTVALVPTYVLINAQIQAFMVEKEENTGGEEFSRADTDVRTTADLLAQLRIGNFAISASAVIEEIQKRATSGVMFKTFYITDTNGLIEKIQVHGEAPTREALAELKNSIEAAEMFETAEVPIADLARDVDLPFAITVTLAKTQ